MRKKACKQTKKGFIQIDYIVAFGFFFIIVVFLTQYVTNYLSTVRDTSDVLLVRSEAVDLLTAGDFSMNPLNWTAESDARRIGFSTRAYRILIIVNNTQQHLVNQSLTPGDTASNAVTFNYSTLGFNNIDFNSTVIYDENNNSISYQRNMDNITFAFPINASQVRRFNVYFDDDSNFSSMSTPVSGTNNITPVVFFTERIDILQFRQIQKIMNANYTLVKNATTFMKDFDITLLDVDSNSNFMSFGPDLPRKGNVVALQRYMLYQNSSGFVKKGRLTVQVG